MAFDMSQPGLGRLSLSVLVCTACGLRYWAGYQGDRCPECGSTASVGVCWAAPYDWYDGSTVYLRGDRMPDPLPGEEPGEAPGTRGVQIEPMKIIRPKPMPKSNLSISRMRRKAQGRKGRA